MTKSLIVLRISYVLGAFFSVLEYHQQETGLAVDK